MDLQQVSPYVRAVSHMTIQGPWQLTPRVLFDYELLYLAGGTMELTIGQQKISAAAGQVYLIPPGCMHAMSVAEGGAFTQMAVHFDPVWRKEAALVPVSYRPMEALTETERGWICPDLLHEQFETVEAGLALQRPEAYERLFQTLEQAFAGATEDDRMICRGALIMLLGNILQELRWRRAGVQNSQTEMLQKLRAFLVEQTERQITMEDVGRAVSLSGRYASQLFKAWTDMTPLQFHRRLQMERADLLLRESQLSVTQVAERLGFENIHAFSRAYKRYRGRSPRHGTHNADD